MHSFKRLYRNDKGVSQKVILTIREHCFSPSTTMVKLASRLSRNRVIRLKTNKPAFNCSRSISIKATDVANEFLNSTSIHGMKYVGQSNKHVFERVCWSCFVTLGLVGSAYCCYLEWCKWRSSPLLITQDPTIASHEPLKFPVVTLCSTHKLSDEKIKLVLEDPKNQWMNSTFLLRAMRYILKFDSSLNHEEEIHRISSALSQHGMNIRDLVNIVDMASISCAEIFVDCLWRSKVLPCEKLFSPILTDGGICCSLRDVSNTLVGSDITNSDTKNNSIFFTDAVHEYGVHSALRIALDAKNSDGSLVISMFDGFKVLLHNENDFPDVVKRGFVAAAGFDHYVAFNAMSLQYTPAIPSIPFEQRDCYVEGEGKLKYYSTYTRSGCLHECRLDMVIDKCGCLPYYIEVEESTRSIPRCPLEAYPCVAAIYAKGHVGSVRGERKCHCPGTCKDQWFTTEITAVPFSVLGTSNSRFFQRITRQKNVTASSYIRNLVGLRIFFRYNSGDSYKMDVPYGTKELIASCGGLLSLGLGFSVISAVELVYFLCIRSCFKAKASSTQSSNGKGAMPISLQYSSGNSAIQMKPNSFCDLPLEKDQKEPWISVLASGEFFKKQTNF